MMLVLGQGTKIHVERLVFGDDFFQFGFDARDILLMGHLDEFFDSPVEPIQLEAISFQDKDFLVIGSNNPFPLGN